MPTVDELIKINELPPDPAFDPQRLLVTGNPVNGLAYKISSSALADKLIEDGAFADVRNTKFYIAGRGNLYDPEAGDSTIVDPTLQGYDFVAVFLNKQGPMVPGTEWGYNNIDTVNFNSTDPDNPGPYFFNPGDIIAIQFEPKISAIAAAPGSVGKVYAGVKRYTANASILPADFQKMQSIIATTTAVTLNLPRAIDYPPGVLLTISTALVNTYQSTIQAFGGDSIFITSIGKSNIILGSDEVVTLFVGDDGAGNFGWFVDNISESYKRVGQLVWSYVPLPNTILAIGDPISKALRPRAVDLVTRLSTLYPGSVVNDATWLSHPTTYRTQWSFGPNPDNLRSPDWRSLGVRALDLGRGIDLDRISASTGSIPGSYQTWAVGPHEHDLIVPPSATSQTDFGSGRFAGGSDNTEPGPMMTVGTENNDGYESRGINGGLLPLICI